MPGEPDPTEHFSPLQAELIGLAYRMTGSLATAEDIAQDTFLRWSAADRSRIEMPRAWLLKAAARLCLDHLKSARQRREHYVGPWLPEPLLESGDPPQQTAHERADDFSVAFLLTLQRLSPVERAVFILHDLFETPFAEIADLLNRSEVACRKLATRARMHLGETGRQQPVTSSEARRITLAFLAASRNGDETALRNLLAAEAVLQSDGGGLRPAALNPIIGADKIRRFFAGLARKRKSPDLPGPDLAGPGLACMDLAGPDLAGMDSPVMHLGRINTLPGYLTLEPDGLPQTTALEIEHGRIIAIYIVRNPDKLAAIQASLPDLQGVIAPVHRARAVL